MVVSPIANWLTSEKTYEEIYSAIYTAVDEVSEFLNDHNPLWFPCSFQITENKTDLLLAEFFDRLGKEDSWFFNLIDNFEQIDSIGDFFTTPFGFRDSMFTNMSLSSVYRSADFFGIEIDVDELIGTYASEYEAYINGVPLEDIEHHQVIPYTSLNSPQDVITLLGKTSLDRDDDIESIFDEITEYCDDPNNSVEEVLENIVSRYLYEDMVAVVNLLGRILLYDRPLVLSNNKTLCETYLEQREQ